MSDLTVKEVNKVNESGKIPLNFTISDLVKDIGSKLTIELPEKTSGEIKIAIVYETSPKASGLQWLTPENTLGKNEYIYFHSLVFIECQISVDTE